MNNDSLTESLLDLSQKSAKDGQYDLAIDYLSRVIHESPHCSQAYGERGDLYRYLGMINESISDFRIEVQLDPFNPDSHMDLALSLAEKGNHRSAINSFSTVIKLNPKMANAFRLRGRSREQIGDIYGAQSDLKEFSRIESNENRSSSSTLTKTITKWYFSIVAAGIMIITLSYAATNKRYSYYDRPFWLGGPGEGAVQIILLLIFTYYAIVMIATIIQAIKKKF